MVDNSNELENELASIKPKRSEGNPIPERVAKQRIENMKKALEEKEKDYYANKKPRNRGSNKSRIHNTVIEEDWLNDIHESSSEQITQSDRFPIISTNSIYLQSGEKCYFEGLVQLVESKIQKEYIHKSMGHSTPGLLKGNRWGSGISWSKEIGEHTETQVYSGMLYVTNKRTIFIEKMKGFDKKHTSISAINEFYDGLEIQYGSKTYVIMTDDATRLYELYESLH